MSKREINSRLKTQSIAWYLSKTHADVSYFTAPENYSPLYRTLYEHLSRGERPPYLPQHYDDLHQQEIRACTSVFDRYLVALYPSRFEASNPHALSEEQTKKEKLIEYLSAEYGKAGQDGDSYNYDREVKRLLGLINDEKAEHFKRYAKSALYKLLVLSYKLSAVNQQLAWDGASDWR